MVDIPEELKDYGFTIETPEDIEKTVLNSLLLIKQQAKKILEAYEDYCQTDSERMKDTLMDAMNTRINHFVQAFKDIVSYIELTQHGCINGESLRYYRRAYENLEGVKKEGEIARTLEFLQMRNDLVHDYFNISKLNHDMVKGISSFGTGFPDLAYELELYCKKHLPEIDLEKNIRKEIKKNH